MPKRLATVSFSPDGRSVLAADRFGDVYEVAVPAADCETPTAATPLADDAAPLLGHFATMTGVAATETRIATCDREGRVRVSHYPDAHDIISFCLGHTAYVTRIAWTLEGLLVSTGGDGTVRLWEADKGSQLGVVNVGGPEAVVAGVAIGCLTPDLVILFIHGEKEVIVLAGVKEMTLRVAGRASISGGEGGAVSGVCFDKDGRLWVSTQSSTTIGAYKVSSDGESLNLVKEICVEVDGGGSSDAATPGEWLASLRKSKFDAEWKGKKRRREDTPQDLPDSAKAGRPNIPTPEGMPLSDCADG